MLSIDCHAHIAPDIPSQDLEALQSCIIAVTRSLGEFEVARERSDANVAWAVGVHPALQSAQIQFTAKRFSELVRKAAVVGEVGLDGRANVSRQVQEATFDAVLDCLVETPRIVSIHSVSATATVLSAIRRRPLVGVILHWWRGTDAETANALDAGCYFSLNAAEVVDPKILGRVPPERVLTETDHPFGDKAERPPRMPGRVHRIESELAEHWGLSEGDVRRQVWKNFRTLVVETETMALLPPYFRRMMLAV